MEPLRKVNHARIWVLVLIFINVFGIFLNLYFFNITMNTWEAIRNPQTVKFITKDLLKQEDITVELTREEADWVLRNAPIIDVKEFAQAY